MTDLAISVHADGLVGADGFWMHWSLDVWILFAVCALAGAYAAGVRRLWKRAGRGRGLPEWRAWAYYGGLAALLLALVSPVARVAGALFSVHMVQHMLLMVVAAPLLILGRPWLGCIWALPAESRRAVGLWWRRSFATRVGWALMSHPLVILVLHVVALWIWHLPRLYQSALERAALHHLEHASFFFTALLFWWALAEGGVGGRWHGHGAGILYVFATALQSSGLGALLLFAREPWYPAHEAGTVLWGMDLLVDQQVAGAIMWIPGGLVYAGAAVTLFLAWVKRADEEVMRREAMGPSEEAARG
jgi:putative membrane protein